MPWSLLYQALAISLAMTLGLEMFFALLWGVRGWHDLILVLLVNILTNPIVVFVYYYVRIRRLPVHYGLITLIMEVFAVVTEALLYRKYGRNVFRPWLFSLSVNSFSYAMGELINKMF